MRSPRRPAECAEPADRWTHREYGRSERDRVLRFAIADKVFRRACWDRVPEPLWVRIPERGAVPQREPRPKRGKESWLGLFSALLGSPTEAPCRLLECA